MKKILSSLVTLTLTISFLSAQVIVEDSGAWSDQRSSDPANSTFLSTTGSDNALLLIAQMRNPASAGNEPGFTVTVGGNNALGNNIFTDTTGGGATYIYYYTGISNNDELVINVFDSGANRGSLSYILFSNAAQSAPTVVQDLDDERIDDGNPGPFNLSANVTTGYAFVPWVTAANSVNGELTLTGGTQYAFASASTNSIISNYEIATVSGSLAASLNHVPGQETLNVNAGTVVVAAVPEPTSAALLLGAGLLLVARRRR